MIPNSTMPGLDFALGEEVDALRDMVRGFSAERVAIRLGIHQKRLTKTD